MSSLESSTHTARSGRTVPWRHRLRLLGIGAGLIVAVASGLAQTSQAAERPALRLGLEGAADAGELAQSTPLTLHLQLALTPAQRADLDALLSAQLDPASPDFRRWLTAEQFASRFGATDAQLASLTSWLSAQGLTVTAVAPSRRSVTVSGNAGAAERAFATSMRRYRIGPEEFFANNTEPRLNASATALIATVQGLDNLPARAGSQLTLQGRGVTSLATQTRLATAAPTLSAELAAPTTDLTGRTIDQLAETITANQVAVLALTGTTCAADLSPARLAELRDLLDQAAAQGITMLAASGCNASPTTPALSPDHATSAPAALSGVLAFTESPRPAAISTGGLDPRPRWQAAPGLPADGLRKEPDLTSNGVALASTLTTLAQQAGTRLGNVSGTLYALAKTPGLYTQPDAVPGTAPAGDWRPATGLGIVDLQTLLKVFPRTSGISTKTSLIASSYAVSYGNPFTLSSNVQVTGVIPYGTNPYPSAPTGVITFTASTQGVLGTAGIDGGGGATLDSGVLPVGTYVLTAAYSGDSSYAPSTSTSNVTITVSLVSARLTATASPATGIPYGAASTITATVTLPGSSAAPTGPVTAQISSGTPVSATLSPNPGSNSATANIDVSVPPPGSYNIHVTCQGTTNFQCQTPVNLPITVVKGYTVTTVSVTPAAPQAGEPVFLTATVGNSGNGTASYTYGGSITFYDSGHLLATAPVATNQATTSVTLSGNRTHNLTAVYTGDANWNGSTSEAVAVNPTILPDALTLSSNISGNSSLAGINLVFTGTVTTTITYRSGPTGTLVFWDTFNGAVVQLGNPSVLVANGSAASIALFRTTGLLPGTHRIYVQYSGDDNYAPAISAVLQLSLSDFSVTMTPPSLTVAQGKSAQVSVLVGNSGGFSGTVSLGCTPPSGSESTCSFAPAAVTGAGATTLTIVTAAAKTAHLARPAAPPGAGWTRTGGAALAALLFCVGRRHRRHLPRLLALIVAAALSANLGCGTGLVSSGGGSGGGGSPGTPPSTDPGTPLGTQNYTITAAGSDGVNVVRHSMQYQVTVQ